MHVIHTISDDIYRQAEALNDFTLYHTQGWHQFLSATFGWQVQAAIDYNKMGQLCWFLPFVRKYRLTKHIAISLPFSHRIGAAWTGDISPQSLNMLKPLEIHEETSLVNAAYVSSNYVSIVNIAKFEDEDALFSSLQKSSIQRKITKAYKQSFTLKTDLTSQVLTDFHNLQSVTRQRQGMPTYPSRFFHNMAQSLSKHMMSIHIAYAGQTPLAGVIFWHFQGTAIYAYGAVTDDRDSLRTGVNQLVMWEGIRHAFAKGCHTIDFGTTPQHLDSLLDYKSKWGASSTRLKYTYLNDDTEAPTVDRESKIVKLASEVLQQLPFPVFKYVSPILLRLAI